jgi:hypothetical protein
MQGKAAIEVLQAAAGAKSRHSQALSLKIASLWIVGESIDAFTAVSGYIIFAVDAVIVKLL